MKKQAFKFTLTLTDQILDSEFAEYLHSRVEVLVEKVLELDTDYRAKVSMPSDNSVTLDVYFIAAREKADKLYSNAERSLPFIFDNLHEVRVTISVKSDE